MHVRENSVIKWLAPFSTNERKMTVFRLLSRLGTAGLFNPTGNAVAQENNVSPSDCTDFYRSCVARTCQRVITRESEKIAGKLTIIP